MPTFMPGKRMRVFRDVRFSKDKTPLDAAEEIVGVLAVEARDVSVPSGPVACVTRPSASRPSIDANSALVELSRTSSTSPVTPRCSVYPPAQLVSTDASEPLALYPYDTVPNELPAITWVAVVRRG